MLFVDKIIVVTEMLKNKYKIFSIPIHVFPTPISNFPKKNKVSCLNIKHPIIGYCGSIYDWKVDLNLLINTMKKLSNFNFVFTGVIKIKNRIHRENLYSLKNFHFLGNVKKEYLASIICQMDVCIIPYNLGDYGKFAFPVKVIDYLSLGKPVVSTALPALKKYKINKLLYTSTDHNKFSRLIRNSLSENKKILLNLRKKTVVEFFWNNQIKQFLEMIYD